MSTHTSLHFFKTKDVLTETRDNHIKLLQDLFGKNQIDHNKTSIIVNVIDSQQLDRLYNKYIMFKDNIQACNRTRGMAIQSIYFYEIDESEIDYSMFSHLLCGGCKFKFIKDHK